MGVMRIKIYTGDGDSQIILFGSFGWFGELFRIDRVVRRRLFVVKICLSYLKKDEKSQAVNLILELVRELAFYSKSRHLHKISTVICLILRALFSINNEEFE